MFATRRSKVDGAGGGDAAHDRYGNEKALGGSSPDVDSETRAPLDGKNEPFLINGEPVADPDAGLGDAERARNERALLWKLDLRLIPWLSLLYLISFLDRSNIGNAKIAGLPQGLHLSADGSQYNAALTIFFVSYALAEPVTNVLLKAYRPSVFIPIIMTIWGICMTTMGLTHDFSGLMAARFFLGLAEAGLFPGVNYYLSCWYTRKEFGIRAAIFFSAAALSGSFGGLLAYLLEKMDGIGGKEGWAWIFIIEGLATVLIGLASFFMVHDFPDRARFLTPDDKARVLRRLKADKQSSAEHESFQIKYFWAAVRDPKTWLSCLVYMGTDGALYAFSLFLPTIIANLGTYTAVQSQLLTIPPYAAATVLTIIVGFVSDRTQRRGLLNVLTSLLGILGFALLLGAQNTATRYIGTFFGAMGIYPTIANTISWASHNFEPSYKRGVAIGIFIGWGNLQGIMSSNIYLDRDKPAFRIGHGVVFAYLTLFLFGGSCLQWWYLARENRRRRNGEYDHLVEGKSAAEIADLGDRRPDFFYMT